LQHCAGGLLIACFQRGGRGPRVTPHSLIDLGKPRLKIVPLVGGRDIKRDAAETQNQEDEQADT